MIPCSPASPFPYADAFKACTQTDMYTPTPPLLFIVMDIYVCLNVSIDVRAFLISETFYITKHHGKRLGEGSVITLL